MDRIHKVEQKTRTLEDSLDQIDGFKNYKGGDKHDQPMYQDAVDNMIKLAELCDKEKVTQPEFFPYYDAGGAQAEWEGKHWYIEIDVNPKRIFFMAVKDRDYRNAATCSCLDINSAFQLAKVFLFYADSNDKESGLSRIESIEQSYAKLNRRFDEHNKVNNNKRH